ncbi:MAG TPA: hypothetical protein VF941_21905 [Clostridia bacterium]
MPVITPPKKNRLIFIDTAKTTNATIELITNHLMPLPKVSPVPERSLIKEVAFVENLTILNTTPKEIPAIIIGRPRKNISSKITAIKYKIITLLNTNFSILLFKKIYPSPNYHKFIKFYKLKTDIKNEQKLNLHQCYILNIMYCFL